MEQTTVLISTINDRIHDVIISMNNLKDSLEYSLHKYARKKSSIFEFRRNAHRTKRFIQTDIKSYVYGENIQHQYNVYNQKLHELRTVIAVKVSQTNYLNEFGMEKSVQFMTIDLDAHTVHWLFSDAFFTEYHFHQRTNLSPLEA